MTKAQQHAAIGAALVIGAIVYLMMQRSASAPALIPSDVEFSPGAGMTMPQGVGITPAPTPTAGSSIPGTDISLGGSPAYLTYNYPELINGLTSNPPWGIAPPAPVEQLPAQNGAGACCCDNPCSGATQWTTGGIVSAYWPLMNAQAENYASVGLNSFGEAPTGY